MNGKIKSVYRTSGNFDNNVAEGQRPSAWGDNPDYALINALMVQCSAC